MNSDFKELLAILNGCQVKYLVVGGYAFIHYAEPRYTKDIDLWVQPLPENALRLREALHPLLRQTARVPWLREAHLRVAT